jgi:glycosyltransferase involved in cell wall biosynthesis
MIRHRRAAGDGTARHTRSVCYFGTWESDYDRNRILIGGLRELGVRVIECHEPVLEQQRHKAEGVKSKAAMLSLGLRFAAAYGKLAFRYLRAPAHDVVMVGYLGHLDVFPARVLSLLRGKPLVFDAFISLHDTLVSDRALFRPTSLPARALWWLDHLAARAADLVLFDTEAHAAYFRAEHGLASDKVKSIPVGADPAFFYPVDPVDPVSSDDFVVLHYSKWSPLHGIPTFLEAAKQLEQEPSMRFVLVGDGQIGDEVRARIAELSLKNLEHVPWMQLDELRQAIASAGATVGILGASDKAERVVPNKVYQSMAVGAPIVTRSGAGAHEMLRDRESALLIPPTDSGALVSALLELKRDPELRAHIASGARAVFEHECRPAKLASRLVALMDSL